MAYPKTETIPRGQFPSQVKPLGIPHLPPFDVGESKTRFNVLIQRLLAGKRILRHSRIPSSQFGPKINNVQSKIENRGAKSGFGKGNRGTIGNGNEIIKY